MKGGLPQQFSWWSFGKVPWNFSNTIWHVTCCCKLKYMSYMSTEKLSCGWPVGLLQELFQTLKSSMSTHLQFARVGVLEENEGYPRVSSWIMFIFLPLFVSKTLLDWNHQSHTNFRARFSRHHSKLECIEKACRILITKRSFSYL